MKSQTEAQKVKLVATKKAWYARNRDKDKARHKAYYVANRTKYIEYARNRRRLDPEFRLINNIRTRLSNAIRDNRKSGSAIRDLGCTMVEFKTYIETQFQVGMNWDNYGEWHIDHKIPLSIFDLADKEQFVKAVHYTNLQPLWATENLIKSNKVA